MISLDFFCFGLSWPCRVFPLEFPRIVVLPCSPGAQRDQAGGDYRLLIFEQIHTHTHIPPGIAISANNQTCGALEWLHFPLLQGAWWWSPAAIMCDQTFVAATFGPCDKCGTASPLMNIYIKTEPITYCSLCVEMVRTYSLPHFCRSCSQFG